MKRKICIFETLHDYQIDVPRPQYLNNLNCLVSIHCVDLIAEEAVEALNTYARKLVNEEYKAKGRSNISWKPVDLDRGDRAKVSDINRFGIGTIVDLDFQTIREWVWLVRTAKAMKDSALLICGCAHTFSVAEKFRWTGYDVEVHVFFDNTDMNRIRNAT